MYTFSITTQYSTGTSFTEKQSQDQQNTCSSSLIIKCAMSWDAMSNIVMHVFLNDTHLLSLNPRPMGDISVHTSVAAHDTTLDNINLRGAWYVPRNIISIAARNTTLEMVHPQTQPCLRYNAIDMLKWKWGDNHFDTKTQFTTRNTTPTNKQQVSKSFSTPHKEIHEFHTLNKSLEIHLP